MHPDTPSLPYTMHGYMQDHCMHYYHYIRLSIIDIEGPLMVHLYFFAYK